VVPPPETKEEIIENFESFAKYHEELIETDGKKAEAPPEIKVEKKVEKKEVAPEEREEEAFLFSEKAPIKKEEKLAPSKKVEKIVPPEKAETLAPPEKLEGFTTEGPVKEDRVGGKPARPKSLGRAERRGPSRFFALLIVLTLVVFGIFYVWSELSSGGRLSPYFENPVKKVTEFWNEIWGIGEGDLIIGELSGYDEKIGETPLFVIEGKVKNESGSTKKYIKIKVVIFNQDKLKVAEKGAVCGRTIGHGELKKQPIEFFQGDMVIQPQTEQEMVTPSGKATPFMVIFKDPPSEAKEFKVEIVEAPTL
jgi:hypothetical protein